MNKLTSGRFLFTIATGVVFIYSTIAGVLNNEQVVSIIMLVVAFYFNKNREEKE